jgi:hypothetical protein
VFFVFGTYNTKQPTILQGLTAFMHIFKLLEGSMAKKSTVPVATISLEDVDRKAVLRNIYEKVEAEPPLGERYPILLRNIIASSIKETGFNLTKADEGTLIDELFCYVASYGPIEAFFNDPHINEIMVNGPDQIFIERAGEIILTDAKYDNNEQVRFAINHIINPLGRYVSRKQPTIDSRLPDGSRVNAVIPPASPLFP